MRKIHNKRLLGEIVLYLEHDIDNPEIIVEIQAVMPGETPTISWDESIGMRLHSMMEYQDDDGAPRTRFTYKEKGRYWLCREYDTYTGDVCDQWKIPHTNWALDYMALMEGILV